MHIVNRRFQPELTGTDEFRDEDHHSPTRRNQASRGGNLTVSTSFSSVLCQFRPHKRGYRFEFHWFRRICWLVLVHLALVSSATAKPANPVTTQFQSHETIRGAAIKHVLDSPEVSYLNSAQAVAGKIDPRLRLRQCQRELDAFHPVSSRPGAKVTVGISCNDEAPWTLYVPIEVTAEYTLLSLTRSLPRGTRLTATDITLRAVRMHPFERPYIDSLDFALGKELSRSLSAGTQLTHNMVKVPRVILRGESITMIAKSGGLEVRSSGKALEDGVVGQKIALQNVSSRQKVEGWVQKDGSVHVLR